ncbi:flavin reductase like domain-containing protein [Aspergillus spectabilis]
MKLLHSRALLSRGGVRSCRPRAESMITHPPHQWHLYRRLTNNTSPSPSPPSQPPKDHNDHSQSLSTQVRLLMRRVPYPVAIITSTDPNPSHSPTSTSPPTSNFRGMTVSSFNTVTLTPTPVISFNVRRPSETLNALLSSGRFLVHLLSPSRDAAALARDFARGNWSRVIESGFGGDGVGEGFEFVPLGVLKASPGGGRIPGKELEEGGKGKVKNSDALPLPLLRRKNASGNGITATSSESSSISFIFECRLLPESLVNVYDHTIVVGKVLRAITESNGTDISTSTDSEELCLAYANTRFWSVGEEV